MNHQHPVLCNANRVSDNFLPNLGVQKLAGLSGSRGSEVGTSVCPNDRVGHELTGWLSHSWTRLCGLLSGANSSPMNIPGDAAHLMSWEWAASGPLKNPGLWEKEAIGSYDCGTETLAELPACSCL